MEQEQRILGLTKQELLVYEALIQLGNSLVSDIASYTKLNRSFVYHCLKVLEEKGLVTVKVLNKKQQYDAVNPSRLLGLLKENETKIKSYIIELEKQKRVDQPEKPDIQVFYGNEGMKTAIDEELMARELLVIGSTPDFEKNLPYYRPTFHLRRIERKIPIKVLFYEKDREYGKRTGKMKNSQVKFLSNKLKIPVTIVLFKDITLLAFWNPVPHTIRIKNKDTTESFKEYFQFLWTKAKP
ncbi:MAG: helix-turn-helix domain-containing protein [Nanoarchaeota archaeon]